MQKNSIRLYTVFVVFCIFGALIIRGISLLTDSAALKVLYGVLVLLGIVINVYQSLQSAGGSVPQGRGANYRLDLFARLAALGCFLHFVMRTALFSQGLLRGRSETHFLVSVAVSALLSLLVCGYFLAVGLSYAKGNYDYRQLTLLRLVPLFWSLTEILCLVADAGELDRDADALLKCGALVFMTLFFFRFAAEQDNDDAATRSTVLTARLFSYLAMLFFFDRMILLLAGEVRLADLENVTALTVMLVGSFVFVYEKELYNNN